MPFMAKQGNNYEEVETLVDTEGREIDYVLSKVGNTYKRTFTKVRELEDTPPLEFKSIKPQANLLDYRIYGQTVDGESVGDRTGNLFDKNKITENKYVYNGSFNNSTASDISEYISISNGLTYTLSWNVSTLSSLNPRQIGIYDNQKHYLGIIQYAVSGLFSTSFTVDIMDAAYIVVTIDKGFQNIMLNAGSTPLPYEPYGYKVPVTVEGKNLFDGEVVQGGLEGGTGAEFDSDNRCRSSYILLDAGTYTISISSQHTIGLFIYSSNNVYETYISYSNSPITFSLETVKKVRFGFSTFYGNVSITPSDISNIMLNIGSTPIAYEPYQSPVTTNLYLPEQIRKVGDEAEYIDYSEQKQHRVRKNLLDENTLISPIGSYSWYFDDEHYLIASIKISDPRAWSYDNCQFHIALSSGTYTLRLSGVGSTIIYSDIQIIKSNNHAIYAANITGETNIVTTFTLNTPETIGIEIKLYDGKYRIMLNEGSTPFPYEPYIENTELDVTLPALPTVAGTNVLSVGTEVQPSDTYIKGNIKGGGAA